MTDTSPEVLGGLGLDEARTLLDLLVTCCPVMVCVLDPTGRCTYSSGPPLARLGLSPGELVGEDVLGRDVHDPVAADHIRAALRGEPRSYTWTSDGTGILFEAWLQPVRRADGVVRAVVGVSVDVSDAWRAEASEHARVLEQQDVLHQLMAVQDAERQRISAGLHDDTVQVLAALALRVSTLRRRLPAGDLAAQRELSTMARDLSQAGERLREMIAGLQPQLLVRSGLRGALTELLARTVGRDGAEVCVHLPQDEEPPEAARRVLYEVAVEAVGNVQRHAGACSVRVVVERQSHGWRMEVVDDGRGMDPRPRGSSGFGLPMMRQRAVAAGGGLEVDSVPGRGTTVRVRVPDVAPFLLERGAAVPDVRGPLEHVLDNVSDAFVALDTSWRYVYVNRRAADLLGTTPERMLGESIWTQFPDAADASFAHVYETAVREQRSIDFEDYFAPADRWFRNRVLPSPGGLTIFFEDVTERRRLQARQDDTDVGSQVARTWFAGLAAHADPVRALRAAAEAVVATGLVTGLAVDAAGVQVSVGEIGDVADVRPVTVAEQRLGEVAVGWPGGPRAWTGELTVMVAQAVSIRLAPGAGSGRDGADGDAEPGG